MSAELSMLWAMSSLSPLIWIRFSGHSQGMASMLQEMKWREFFSTGFYGN